jgi:hypothetical protein
MMQTSYLVFYPGTMYTHISMHACGYTFSNIQSDLSSSCSFHDHQTILRKEQLAFEAILTQMNNAFSCSDLFRQHALEFLEGAENL